jgi:hypothetical protein
MLGFFLLVDLNFFYIEMTLQRTFIEKERNYYFFDEEGVSLLLN